jgi:hypothetical protein
MGITNSRSSANVGHVVVVLRYVGVVMIVLDKSCWRFAAFSAIHDSYAGSRAYCGGSRPDAVRGGEADAAAERGTSLSEVAETRDHRSPRG